MKNALLISALAATVAVSAACSGRNVLAPTSPAIGSGPAVGAPSMTGAWTSAAEAEPEPEPAPESESDSESDPEPVPAPEPSPETPPEPEAPSPPPASRFHVEDGPPHADRAKQVVLATSDEFPHLTAVMGSEQDALAAADELLGRTIWHLQLAGFQAARQRNPSGAISSDKVAIFVDGRWRVYDIYSLGTRGRATRVQWLEVPLPNPVANGGIPD